MEFVDNFDNIKPIEFISDYGDSVNAKSVFSFRHFPSNKRIVHKKSLWLGCVDE